MLDKHAPGIEIQAPEVAVRAEKVLAGIRDVQQGVELHGRVHGDMLHVQGSLGVIAQGLVEIVVLLLGHGGLGLTPERGLGVDALAVHKHREGHKGRMFADGRLHPEFFQKFHGVVLEMGLDHGAAFGFFGVKGLHTVRTQAVADPDMGLGVLFKSRARGHFHPVGHHEDRVKTHAETPDDVGRVGRRGFAIRRAAVFAVALFLAGAGFGGQTGQKLLGAGLGDGAQIFGQLPGGHAQAGVGDGQGFGVLVDADPDFQGQIRLARAFAPVDAEAQLVQGVRGVGNKLTQKNFPVGVQGIGKNMQHLAHFGAELAGLFAGFGHDEPPEKNYF